MEVKLDVRWLGQYTIKKSLGKGLFTIGDDNETREPSSTSTSFSQVSCHNTREDSSRRRSIQNHENPVRSHHSPKYHSVLANEAVVTFTPVKTQPVPRHHSPSFTPVREGLAFMTEDTLKVTPKKCQLHKDNISV